MLFQRFKVPEQNAANDDKGHLFPGFPRNKNNLVADCNRLALWVVHPQLYALFPVFELEKWLCMKTHVVDHCRILRRQISNLIHGNNVSVSRTG